MQKNCVLWVKREQSDGEIGIHFSVTEKWARQVRIENDNCKTWKQWVDRRNKGTEMTKSRERAAEVAKAKARRESSVEVWQPAIKSADLGRTGAIKPNCWCWFNKSFSTRGYEGGGGFYQSFESYLTCYVISMGWAAAWMWYGWKLPCWQNQNYSPLCVVLPGDIK